RDLHRRHPLPASRRGLTDHDRLLAVALHGEAALRLLVPRFALRAGLIRRAEVGGKGLLKHAPRGTGGGGGYSYCGGGGGGGGGD
ncbi:TIGR04222 domain-containing membrane protein, partial [Streptomyces coeruleorubidus]